MLHPFHAYMRKEAATAKDFAKSTANYQAAKVDADKKADEIARANAARAKPKEAPAVPSADIRTDTSRSDKTAKPRNDVALAGQVNKSRKALIEEYSR